MTVPQRLDYGSEIKAGEGSPTPAGIYPLEDMVLKCEVCGARFLFSAGEQRYYLKHGFKHIPKRCPRCRKKRWEWHEVVCELCGVETKVPFKPTGVRPVYCYECYKKLKAEGQIA